MPLLKTKPYVVCWQLFWCFVVCFSPFPNKVEQTHIKHNTVYLDLAHDTKKQSSRKHVQTGNEAQFLCKINQTSVKFGIGTTTRVHENIFS